jgi:hypothetical protein
VADLRNSAEHEHDNAELSAALNIEIAGIIAEHKHPIRRSLSSGRIIQTQCRSHILQAGLDPQCTSSRSTYYQKGTKRSSYARDAAHYEKSSHLLNLKKYIYILPCKVHRDYLQVLNVVMAPRLCLTTKLERTM